MSKFYTHRSLAEIGLSYFLKKLLDLKMMMPSVNIKLDKTYRQKLMFLCINVF